MVFQDAQLSQIVWITLNVVMMESVWTRPVQNVDTMLIVKELTTQAFVCATQIIPLEIHTKAA